MITQEEVKKIANLARLHLSDEEAHGYAEDISGVLKNFETIRSLDTSKVASENTMSALHNIAREDVVQENILGTPEELLKNTITKDGYVEVPAVFSDIAAI